jgi:trans-2,3-dihydro-3-hydroxyanthranilate isomerase
MPTFPYTLLDVFTATPLEGNGLAVVHDADELDDELMQRFAIETRLSETTFVQAATADGADYRNRIWMMTGELPFAGHPSLGTAVAVARARGESEVTYRQQTLAGVQPVDVSRGGDSWEASMLQEPAKFFDELESPGALRALGLEPSAAHPELPPQAVSTGLRHLMLPLRTSAELAAVEPDYDAIAALLAPIGATCVYAFAVGEAGAGSAAARAFTGSATVAEDPATGSAAGPLCAYLAERTGVSDVTISQGVQMGRPSVLRARVEGDRVRVSGSVVPVIDGTLTL